MRPHDLPLLASCASPTISADGAVVVVAVGAPDLAADETTGVLWTVATDGSTPPRALTRGHRDTAPALRPDGKWVAFLRAAPGQAPQLHVMEAGGGEPVALTGPAQHPLGAGPPVWSPDGRALAYTARVPEPGRYPAEPGVGAGAEPPRLITTLAGRLDGVGYVTDRRSHVFALDVDPARLDGRPGARASEVPAPRQLTGGDADDTAPTWSADGRWVLCVSARHPGAEGDLRRGVHRVPAAASADADSRGEGASGRSDAEAGPEVVLSGDLRVAAVAADPDGQRLWLLAEEVGPDGLDHVATSASLFVAPLDGSTPPRRLTDPATTDLGDPAAALRVDALGALVTERHRGALRLLRVTADGDVRVLMDGRLQVTSVTSNPDGRRVAAVVADEGTCGDLVALADPDAPDDLGVPAARRLTDLGASLRAAGIRPLVELDVLAPDGHGVHGWAVLPDPSQYGSGPHPVILMIHGGPFAQFGWGVFDEAQVAAGAGYAVVMGNPRGSAGYGRDHGRAVLGALGGADADDVLALLDAALADPDLGLDASRVGVQGGSYGGYLAAMLTTRTGRFTAAIVERGYLDPPSFAGASDIGWYFPDAYHGSPTAMREQSPMTYVDRVRTPTLVIHSEDDLRCPVDQGWRWFSALRRAGVDSELLLFPGEGHELTRSGRPRHRLARFEHVLRWWGRHLPV